MGGLRNHASPDRKERFMSFDFKRCTAALLLAALILALLAPAALAESTAYVNCSSLTVRATASASGTKLGSLSRGAKVQVISTANGWAKISYNGKTAYVASRYLSKTAPSSSSAASGGTRAYVKAATYLYSSPSTSSGKVRALSKGLPVYVTGRSGSYCRVRVGSQTGYVLTRYLRKAATGSSSTGSKASRVVSIAKSLLGRPYDQAASGPYSFDCSGFTYYCYQRVGVTLKRLSQGQGYNNGSKVGKASLKAGDLVFFDTNPDDGDSCDHVGIYIGSGLFIHASSSAGKVIMSSLSTGYYAETFSWGRRVF